MTTGGQPGDDRTGADRTDVPADARVVPRARTMFVMLVVLPLVTLMSVWLWIRHERGKVRERGVAACVASGRDAAWCDAAADKNHDRCMELTFRPASKTSGEWFDDHGYIECLDIGAQAYWNLSAARAAERRRHPPE